MVSHSTVDPAGGRANTEVATNKPLAQRLVQLKHGCNAIKHQNRQTNASSVEPHAVEALQQPEPQW
ncbi:MAG: hypothetical protein ACI9FJ_001815 [Alteromonadaceae bacterium]|jgi:hypothetical protein